MYLEFGTYHSMQYATTTSRKFEWLNVFKERARIWNTISWQKKNRFIRLHGQFSCLWSVFLWCHVIWDMPLFKFAQRFLIPVSKWLWWFDDFVVRSRYLRQGKVITSHSKLWDVITYPCLRYLLLATKSSFVCIYPKCVVKFRCSHGRKLKYVWDVVSSNWFCCEVKTQDSC